MMPPERAELRRWLTILQSPAECTALMNEQFLALVANDPDITRFDGKIAGGQAQGCHGRVTRPDKDLRLVTQIPCLGNNLLNKSKFSKDVINSKAHLIADNAGLR